MSSDEQQQMAMEGRTLRRAQSLPTTNPRTFGADDATSNAGDSISSDGSDADYVDQLPVVTTKRASHFAPGSLLAQDAAERHAKQQQTQNYEAVMRKFQVRKVALRSAVAFSSSRRTSAGSPHRSILVPPQLSPRTQGLHEVEAVERTTVADARAAGTSGRHLASRRSVESNSPSLAASANGDGSRHSKAREVHPHSFPGPSRSVRFTCYRFFVKKKRRLLRRLRRLRDNLTSVIYPTSAVQRVREGVLFASFAVQLVCLPLLPVYFPSQSALTLVLQITTEWIYCVDCVLGFNTAFFRKTTRELVRTRRDIARHYLFGWFGFDVLSSLPVNTVVFFASGGKGLLEVSPLAYLLFDNVARIPRFVSFFRMMQTLRAAARALRAGENFWTWALLYSRYSHLLRIARLVCIVMLIEHYMACLWQYLSSSTPPSALDSPLELYVQNFYNVVLLVNGQSVNTESVAQTVYSIVAIFVGSFILAIMFGNVAMLVSNFNSSATSYQRNLEKVFGTMKKMQLPPALQERVRQYFTHLWQEYDAVDADLVQFPRELTPTLALEVGLCKYMNLIMGVPYWRECSPDFVSHVIRSLVVRVYLPDDFVLRRREINQDLFMINRGTCEIKHLSPESDLVSSQSSARISSQRGLMASTPNEHVRAQQYKSDDPKFRFRASKNEIGEPSPNSPELLRAGEVFGEMGLLVNFEHQFNIRAVTHVEMCVLSRQAFQKLLMRFQLDRPIVLAALLEDAILKNELPFSMEQNLKLPVSNDQLLQWQDELQHMTQRLDIIEVSQAKALDALSVLHQAVARITKNVVAMKAVAPGMHQQQRQYCPEDEPISERGDSIDLVEELSARQYPSNSAAGPTQPSITSPSGSDGAAPPHSFRLRASRAMTGLAPRQQQVHLESDESTASGSTRLPARRRATMTPRRNAIIGGSVKKHELLADSLWMQYSVPK